MGKGSIPEDHPLFAGSIGDPASTSGNRVAATADVILAVGCRFTDWSTSSYRKGVTFSIPPSTLIQVDIDPREIGKNYPVAIGLVADALAALRDLYEAAVQIRRAPADYQGAAYFAEVQRLKDEWAATQDTKRNSDARPMTQARALKEIRSQLDRGAIVVTGAGLPQAIVRQDWPVYDRWSAWRATATSCRRCRSWQWRSCTTCPCCSWF
jgi:acetolactate synthase-1/2/3 large subunit